MVQPIDYMGMLPQIDLGQSLLSGIQAGSALGAVRDKRQADEQAKAMQAQYSADLEQTLANPTAQNFAALTAKYPQQREAFKQSWEILGKDQQDAEFGAGVKAYSALRNGRPDAALQVLDEQIAAMENSGQDISDLRGIRAQIQRDPNAAAGHIGLVLSSVDPDRWGKIAVEQRASEQAPFDLTEKQAKAQKAAVDAKFAESMAVQDLQKKGWEIAKLEADTGISRQNSRIAAINAQIARETKADKIQELQQKVQNAQLQRDESVRMKADEAQGSADTLNMVSGLLGDLFEDEDSLRAATGTGAFRGAIPGTKARSTAGKIAQLQDVLASANLDKLKGPMSDKDIEFVRRLGSSLDRYQNEEKFIEELKRLNEILPGAMDKLNTKYGSSFSLMKNTQGIEDATGAPPPGAVRRIR